MARLSSHFQTNKTNPRDLVWVYFLCTCTFSLLRNSVVSTTLGWDLVEGGRGGAQEGLTGMGVIGLHTHHPSALSIIRDLTRPRFQVKSYPEPSVAFKNVPRSPCCHSWEDDPSSPWVADETVSTVSRLDSFPWLDWSNPERPHLSLWLSTFRGTQTRVTSSSLLCYNLPSLPLSAK